MAKPSDKAPDPSTSTPPGSGEPQAEVAPAEEGVTGDGWGSHMPISVPGGDFATRGVRKRTTTQPRGYPTVGAATAPPTPTPAVVLALPVTAAVAEATDSPPPRGRASRVSSGKKSQSAVDEFLSSPPTPPPETDPIEQLETPIPSLFRTLTSDGDLIPTPTPHVDEEMVLPSPSLEPHSDTALSEDGLALDAASLRRAARGDGVGTPLPDDQGDKTEVEVPLEVDEAEVHVDQRATMSPLAPPAIASVFPIFAGAAPEGTEEISPLAQTLAHMAQALGGPDGEAVPLGEDVEIVDAPLVGESRPDARKRASTPPPLPMAKTRAPASPPPVTAPEATPEAAPTEESVAPTPLVASPEALAQRPRRPKHSKPWFEEVFDEDYLRTLPYMTAQQTLREVSFIEQSLVLPAGAEVLDVACGYGRHAIELTQRGLNVTGIDLSLPLLIRAADECHRRGITVNFAQADMREIQFDRQFDGAYCMLTSFGYFDEETNLRVAEGIAKTLKPGARLLLDIVNRDYVAHALPSRVWWEGDGCIVLEEVDFNFHTSRIVSRRTVVFDDGRQVEHEVSVRAYSLHELGRLLRQAGFRVIEVSGGFSTRGNFFGAASRNILALAEKRSD